jgi:hypothetical protein
MSLGIGFHSNGTISEGTAQSRVGSSVTVLHFGHILTTSLIWRIVRAQAGPLQHRAAKCVQRGTFRPTALTSTLANKTGYIEVRVRGVSITLMKPQPNDAEGE